MTLYLQSASGDVQMTGLGGFAGTIRLANDGSTGNKWNVNTGVTASSATLVIDAGSQLYLGSGGATFAAIRLSGTGNTESRGAIRIESQTLTGPVTLLGDTTIGITAGTVAGTITGGVSGTSILTIGAPSQPAGTNTFSSAITDGTGVVAVSLTKGTTTFSGANTYSGTTTIAAGATFQAGNANALPNGAGKSVVDLAGTLNLNNNSVSAAGLINSGTVTNSQSGSVVLTVGNGGLSGTFAGRIQNGSGTLGLTKTGTGTLTLTGPHGFTGQTLVTGGTLVLAGGTFGTGAAYPGSRAVTIGVSSGENATFTMSAGTIPQTASAGLMIGDSGTGTFNQSGGSVTLGSSSLWLGDNTGGNGTANFSGGTFTSTGGMTVVATRSRGTINVSGSANVTLSTLQLGHSAGSGQTATVNLDGGRLTVDQILKVNATASVYLNSGTLTARSSNASFMTGLNTAEIKAGGAIIDTNGFAITIGQALNQNAGSTGGGLTKLNSGTLTLSAVNGFTGTLNVNAGTLEATAATSGNASAIGAGGNTVNVAAGATLRFSTNNRTAGYHSGAVNVNGGTITMNASDISFAAANTTTFGTSAGTIGGSGQWRFRGGATVRVLPAANGSTISVATLDMYDGNEVLNIDSGATLTVSSLITNDSGGGSLTKTGSGTVVLSSTASTYGRTITVRAGTLAAGADAPSGAVGAFGNATSAIVLGDGSTGAADAPSILIGGAYTVGRAISIGSVSNSAAYRPVLGGTNTSGVAAFSGAIALATTAVGYTGLTLQAAPGGTVDFSGAWTTNNKPITIGSAGNTGTIRLTSNLATTGTVTIAAGTLLVNAANALGSATTPVALAGGTLDLGGVATTIGTLTGSTAITGAAGSTLTVTQAANTTFTGTVGGSVALVKAGASRLALSAANTATGGVTVASGSLQLVGGSDRLPASSAVVLGSSGARGTLALGDGTGAVSQTLADLTATGSGGAVVGGNATASTLTLAIPSAGTFSGALGGAGTNENNLAIVKTGAGALTLTGTATYTGATTVAAGSLVLGSGMSITSSSTTTVAGGATLAGTGTAGNTVMSNAGILSPGIAGSGTLTVGNLTFGGGSGDAATVNVGVDGLGTLTSLLSANGNVTLNGGTNSVTFAFGSALSLVPSGTYAVLSYTGTPLTDVTGFKYSGVKGGRQSVSFASGSQVVNLVVGNAYPVWSGTFGSGWSTTDNWKLNTDAAPTDFQANDTVVFNDSADTGTVDVTANVNPATTTFNGSTVAYTLQSGNGAGIVDGAEPGSLIKSGAATVTIATTNSYSGGTTLSGGILNVTGSQGLGTGPVAISAGTLNVTGAGGLGAGAVSLAGGLLAVTGSGSVNSASVTMTSGTIRVGSDAALGPAAVAINGGELSSDSTTARAMANAVAIGGGVTLGNAVNTGPLTLSGSVDFAGGVRQLTMDSNVTFAGALANGGFTKAGAAVLTVSGSSSYAGGTTLAAGTLRVGNDAAFGSGQVTVNGGVLSSSGTVPRTLPNAIAVGGAVTLGDATNAGLLTFAGNTDLGGTTRQLTLASNVTISGIVANGGLTKAGAGTLSLTGTNTYAAGTTLSAGMIAVGSNAALGTGPVTLAGGAMQSDSATARTLANGLVFTANATFGDAVNNGLLTFTGTTGLGGGSRTITTVSNLTLSGIVSNGNLVKAGAGALTLSAVNTYGKTTINSGTVIIAADSGLGTAPGSAVADQLTFAGGVLRLSAGGQTLAANRGITLSAGGGTIDTSSIGGAQTTSIAGVIAGTGPLTLRSTGNQSASGGADGGRGILLSATNTFTGDVTVTSGFASYASDASFGNAANQIILAGGGLLDNAVNVPLARPIVISAGTSTFRMYSSAAVSWSSPISGGATVNRTDGGTLTLTGTLSGFSGTYDNQLGDTVLSGAAPGLGAGARLRISGATVTFSSGRLGSGTAVMNGGSLRWASGNTQDVSANISLLDGVTAVLDTNGNSVNFAGGFGAGTSGNVQKGGAGTLTLSGSYGFTGWLRAAGGTLETAGTVAGVSELTVTSATVAISGGSVSATAVRTSDASAAASVVNHSGGTLVVTGSNNTSTTGASLLIGHWAGGASTTWTMSGGTLTSTSAMMSLGWDATSTVNQSGGTANLLGINLANGRSNSATYNLTGGRLNLGSSGITANTAKTVNLGSGTVGALADWSTSQSLPLTSTAPGVTFDPSGFGITLSGSLTGSGALVVAGSGTLTLSNAANSFSGGTRVSGGVLAFVSGALGSSGTVTLGGGTLRWSSGNTQDISARLALANASTTTLDIGDNNVSLANGFGAGSTGGIVKAGASTLTLGGSNGYSGGTTFSAGSLLVGNDSALGSGAVTMAGGILSSDGPAARALPNAFVLTGDATLGSAANQGLLALTNVVDLGGSRQITTPSDVVISGTVVNGSLKKLGAGALTLAGANTFTGGARIDQGTLGFASGGLGSSGAVTMNGGTLRWATGNTQDISSRLAFVDATAATLDTNGNTVTLASGFGAGSSGSLVKVGAGTLAISGTPGYSGNTSIDAGTLAITGVGSIGASPLVTVNATGVLDIATASGPVTINEIAGSGGVALGAQTLRSVITSNVAQFAGVISGSGDFTKTGAGTLTFSAAQALTGRVTVEAGTLSLGLLDEGGDKLFQSASAIVVGRTAGSGATLDASTFGLAIVDGQMLGGHGTVNGNVTLEAGSLLSPGGSVGTLTVNGTTTFSGTSGYVFDMANMRTGTAGTNGWDLLATMSLTITSSPESPYTIFLRSLANPGDDTPGSMSGSEWDPGASSYWKFVDADTAITLPGGPWYSFNDGDFKNSINGLFSVVRGDDPSIGGSNTDLYIVYAAVPEPGALALAGIGLAAAALWGRRRRVAQGG